MSRKIIHIDADCFFAALEMRDNPALRGRPMAVGGRSDRRGVIATCNYEARQFGVRSAQASAQALRLCPGLLIVPGRMDVYREASELMRDIFYDYTSLVEPLSLDEAYLDVSECSRCGGSATRIAEEIRQRVFDALKITVSAGVAPNKFLAKVASDWQKPNGLTVIAPERVVDFVTYLPVTKVHGVGKVTASRMHSMGIVRCGDLRCYSAEELTARFGRFGERLADLCWGRDERPVVASRRRKSLSVERTYSEDLPNLASCEAQLSDLLEQLQRRLRGVDNSYRVIKGFVKVKFSDFTSTTLERVGTSACIEDYRALLQEALERSELPVRLLGVGVRFVDLLEDLNTQQLPLFDLDVPENKALT